ncbi:MAG: hypothetical protein J7530_11370 [Novosphingobium sp.]|nr:hypothetical protein [Novosphingobium sp.]
MKNVQIIDSAANATFSLFQVTDDEFSAIFPSDSEMQIAEDVFERLGKQEANRVIGPMWNRPILKRDAVGIHGTLFYDSEHRREYLPASRREIDWPDLSLNPAQRAFFKYARMTTLP